MGKHSASARAKIPQKIEAQFVEYYEAINRYGRRMQIAFQGGPFAKDLACNSTTCCLDKYHDDQTYCKPCMPCLFASFVFALWG